MRLVFMGTPDFAVPCLSEIVGRGHEVVAVYTQPPRPAGRGMTERRSPVHEKAATFALPVVTPKSLKDPAEQQAFAVHDLNYVINNYLPEKLASPKKFLP